MRLLQDLGLGFLLARPDGLDAVETWDSMLSPGEQQRLGFARVLYHKCVPWWRAHGAVGAIGAPWGSRVGW